METGNISNGLCWKDKLWHRACVSITPSPCPVLLCLQETNITASRFANFHRNSVFLCVSLFPRLPAATWVWLAALTVRSAWPRRPSARTTSLRSQRVWTEWRSGWPSSGTKLWWGEHSGAAFYSFSKVLNTREEKKKKKTGRSSHYVSSSSFIHFLRLISCPVSRLFFSFPLQAAVVKIHIFFISVVSFFFNKGRSCSLSSFLLWSRKISISPSSLSYHSPSLLPPSFLPPSSLLPLSCSTWTRHTTLSCSPSCSRLLCSRHCIRALLTDRQLWTAGLLES